MDDLLKAVAAWLDHLRRKDEMMFELKMKGVRFLSEMIVLLGKKSPSENR